MGRSGTLGDTNGDGWPDLIVDATHVRGSSAGPLPQTAVELGPADGRSRSSYAASSATGDLNGDGRDEIVLSDPGHPGGGVTGAGEVHIIPGSFSGPNVAARQILHQGLLVGAATDDEPAPTVAGVAEADDGFGTALAIGDFDGDGYDDLAIGTPAEDVGSLVDAGAVNVLYGSPNGPDGDGDQIITQAGAIAGVPEAGDLFGAALVSADFDRDGYDDLAIGAPGESVGDDPSGVEAGMVLVLRGSPDGLGPDDQEMITQAGEMPGEIEAGNHLGAALATGDPDGDGVPDLVIGLPGKDLLSGGVVVADAGAVLAVKSLRSGFTPVGSWLLHQSGPLAGVAESGDLLGLHLALADLDGDRRDDLLIGVPDEGLSGPAEGLVHVVPGTYVGLEGYGNFWFDQADAGLGVGQPGDRFGSTLLVAHLDNRAGVDVGIGSPGRGTGLVVPGHMGFLTPKDTVWPGPFVLGDDPGLEAVRWLAQQLEASGYDVSVSAHAQDEGEIFTYDSTDRLLPASNQKVITAIGAFELLPDNFRFTTTVDIDRHRNLVINGGGDPTLTTADLAFLASQIVNSVDVPFINNIIVNGSRYGMNRLAPGVHPANMPQWTGPLSTFIVNDNRHRADLSFLSWPEIGNAQLLAAELEARGLDVRGGSYVAAAPIVEEEVARDVSVDRDALLLRMLLFSDNEIADSLVREMGYRASGIGTMETGKQAISNALADFGVDLSIDGDGSGLSYTNGVSAGEYTQLLENIRSRDWFPTFYYSLPIAGVSGTLGGRLGGWLTAGKLRAKTGSLFVSRALSGYTDTPDVRLVTFSVVVNGNNASSTTATIDQMVTILSGLG